MRIAVLLGASLFVACGSRSQDGERSTGAPLATTAPRASRAPTPIAPTPSEATPPAPSEGTPPAPAEPAMPAPGGLATLAQALSAARVERIERVEGVIFTGPAEQPRATVTWAKDASGTWACLERGPAPLCLVLPAEARPGRAFGFGDGEIHLTWTRANSSATLVISPSGAVTVTERARGAPRDATTPLATPATRPAPALLGALTGVEVSVFTDEMVATAGGRLMSCRVRSLIACGAPIEVAALSRDNTNLTGLTCVHDPFCSVDVAFESRSETVREDGVGQLIVGVDPVTLATTLIVVAINDVFRETRGENDASEEIEIEAGLFDHTSPDCLFVEPSRGFRTVVSASGGERRSSQRLRRAPPSVPPEGVDPYTTTLEGNWTVVPTGGLRRRDGRCPEI